MTILMHDSTVINPGIDPRPSPQKTSATGDCALFILPHVVINGKNTVADERAVINIPLPAKLLNGYTGKYTLRLGNGVTGTMTISPAGKQREIMAEYLDIDPVLTGILADAPRQTGGNDHTTLTIRPDNNWLAPGQRFHVFKIAMGGYQRCHDKENHLPPYYTADILFGIQRPG